MADPTNWARIILLAFILCGVFDFLWGYFHFALSSQRIADPYESDGAIGHAPLLPLGPELYRWGGIDFYYCL
jgi:hypothetical protein